ncbi:hypothetical protein TWF106_007113 [Orbilia oligospora]|uniref:Zn(2)-C6 fungal-type domain-containing protein n=1 Tax=Orbilia oligospora TaxID=2813651 RepID=A0A6G1M3U0_ORBOL|nr:hypothetical protein TWF788_009892 [Orbilia oligospora]KAF3207874.1 hypothetical protein TWF679_008206 [Orbilia oligospora]KAF3219272.1 hypothetical protein TWF106_007113 [Orbilia oligospora]KAF3220510.1 hypothetical protein TWF191_007409 [Orbilia oligospora]KAF3244077.1 hypothetical protein TWF192_007883 [Orbilia oligospora]
MRTKPPSAATTPPSSTASNRPVKRRKTLSDTAAVPNDLLPSPTDNNATITPENAGQQHLRSASLDHSAIANGYANFQNSPTESYGTEGARSPATYAAGDLTAMEMDIDGAHFSGEASTLTSPTTNPKVNISGAEKQITKRACNECRQQKLRCDVVQNPYTDCSRCKRLKLECRIDSNFKRTVKRSKIAEMEKEVAYLRSMLGMASATSSPVVAQPPIQFSPGGQISQPLLEASASAISSFAASQSIPDGFGAFGSQANNNDQDLQLTSLLADMKNDRRPKLTVESAPPKDSQTLEDVMLTKGQIDELFKVYFDHYHPFLPMLDPTTSPSMYYSSSQLLFWVIISIGSRRYPSGEPNLLMRLSRAVSKLVWSTLATVPHNKFVVKALILISTWPFPTSSTLNDPTYMLSCLAVSVAIQMGLHRPAYTKDYTKFANKAKADSMEICDRTTTWACCNISSQSVSTGLGLPPDTQYDWTISNAVLHNAKYPLPTDIRNLVLIQRFVDTATRSLNSNNNDPIGLLERDSRPAVITLLERRLDELEGEINSTLTPLHRIYLLCARLHLRSFYLFESPTTSSASTNRVINLYSAAESLVTHILKIEDAVVDYCPVYVYQMFTCAAFMMLKVLRSSYFNRYLDVESGIKGFNAALGLLRNMSIADNDLPARMADVLTQLWECGSLGPGSATGGSVDGSVISGAMSTVSKEEGGEGGETLHSGWDLRIRSRMSQSVVYDSLWKWREQFRERNAILQAREEVGGAVASVVDKLTLNPTPPQQAGSTITPQQSQTPAAQQQQITPLQHRQTFPVLSNAFQRPSTPLIPNDLLATLSTPAPPTTPGGTSATRLQNPMLPIPTTASNSETPSVVSAGGLDTAGSVVDINQMFGVAGMAGGMGGVGGDAFDLNWVLDGFEFLPLPGDDGDIGGVGGAEGAAGIFGVGI